MLQVPDDHMCTYHTCTRITHAQSMCIYIHKYVVCNISDGGLPNRLVNPCVCSCVCFSLLYVLCLLISTHNNKTMVPLRDVWSTPGAPTPVHVCIPACVHVPYSSTYTGYKKRDKTGQKGTKQDRDKKGQKGTKLDRDKQCGCLHIFI